jgi:hypothetical protein
MSPPQSHSRHHRPPPGCFSQRRARTPCGSTPSIASFEWLETVSTGLDLDAWIKATEERLGKLPGII